jgi:hypothetical protein
MSNGRLQVTDVTLGTAAKGMGNHQDSRLGGLPE